MQGVNPFGTQSGTLRTSMSAQPEDFLAKMASSKNLLDVLKEFLDCLSEKISHDAKPGKIRDTAVEITKLLNDAQAKFPVDYREDFKNIVAENLKGNTPNEKKVIDYVFTCLGITALPTDSMSTSSQHMSSPASWPPIHVLPAAVVPTVQPTFRDYQPAEAGPLSMGKASGFSTVERLLSSLEAATPSEKAAVLDELMDHMLKKMDHKSNSGIPDDTIKDMLLRVLQRADNVYSRRDFEKNVGNKLRGHRNQNETSIRVTLDVLRMLNQPLGVTNSNGDKGVVENGELTWTPRMETATNAGVTARRAVPEARRNRSSNEPVSTGVADGLGLFFNILSEL